MKRRKDNCRGVVSTDKASPADVLRVNAKSLFPSFYIPPIGLNIVNAAACLYQVGEKQLHAQREVCQIVLQR